MIVASPIRPDAGAGDSRDDVVRAECVRLTRQLGALVRRRRTGSLAELRRLDRTGGGPPPEAFWDLVERARVAPARERFWEALLPLMVTCPHRRGAHAGRTLRDARVAASRIERWLRLGADDARVELRKLVRRMDAVDWVELSALLDRWDDPIVGDARKRAFARDYFLFRPAPVATPVVSPHVQAHS